MQNLGLHQGPISVVLYDAYGIGSGASGAAAGILHPCSPKGKVILISSICVVCVQSMWLENLAHMGNNWGRAVRLLGMACLLWNQP